jgi:hypothetical protein
MHGSHEKQTTLDINCACGPPFVHQSPSRDHYRFVKEAVFAMNKRVLALSAACAVGALPLSACGGGGSGSADGKVTLKLVAADYGDKASNSSTLYWKDLAKRFTAANP